MDVIKEIVFPIAVVLTILVFSFAAYKRSIYFLHMMQLEEYKNNNYLKWLGELGREKALNPKVYMTVIYSAIAAIAYNTLNKEEAWSIFITLWIVIMIVSVDYSKKKAKKPLVFTKRVKRLYATNIACIAILPLVAAIFMHNYDRYLNLLLVMSAVYFFIPYIMYISNHIIAPVERKINKHFYDMAKDAIREYKNLTSVGITGSYGKTTTKFVVGTILSEKFNTLKTPHSYNTPMGLSKVINNMLKSEHQIFVAEMGARKTGDIEELARLVGPKIGVLTSVGPAHIETFKTIENIMKTKYELIEELPADGIAIFNYDNDYIKRLADKTFKEKLLYGMEDIEKLDLYVTDIEVSQKGSKFMLHDKEGSCVECKSKLLGRHNISNLLAGAAVGKALGMTLEEVARGINKVESVEHRLQLIDPGTGVIVIDDGFNSNPDGAKAALEVLDKFDTGKKIIVTPGMIELGDTEEKENNEFGKNIAKVCDYVILVGKKRTEPIYKGIISKGFSTEKISVVNTIEEAQAVIASIVKSGDVVLFENDLPDTFDESN